MFVAVLGAYWYAAAVGGTRAEQTSFAFTAWMLGHVVLAFVSRSEREPLGKIGLFSNRVVNIWALATVAFLLIGMNVPVIAARINLVPIRLGTLALLALAIIVWMSLLGFGYALETGQFLRVEAFVERLHGPRRQVAEIFGALAGATVAAVSTYACFLTFYGSWKFGTRSIQPSATPLWLPQIVMPFAFAWLVILYARITAVRARALWHREAGR
jgi:TRAP-type mannitol/chloroaromatic compound transport system permease small subunit